MIYKLKQKIRHSELGENIVKSLEKKPSLFLPLFSLMFKMRLAENCYEDGYLLADESKKFFEQNKEKIQTILRVLADEESKNTFRKCLRYRESFSFVPPFCKGTQYFPQDLLHLSKQEVLVDCGAYTGDSILSFLKYTNNKYKKIVAFEPDALSAKQLNAHNFPNCICLSCGVWNKKETLSFYTDGKGHSTVEKEDWTPKHSEEWEKFPIQLERIDDLPVCADMTFLKMNLEGAELKALKGAEQTIRKNRPKLAICICHSDQDMIEIPLWIMSLNMGYKLYMRHYSLGKNGTVCYAL